ALTGRHGSAAVAGAAYAFNPYRASQISHLQMLWVFWMPIALLALHRYARDGRLRWAILFSAMWLGQALSNSDLLLFFPLLVALWIAWFLLRPEGFARAASLAAIGTCSAGLLLPIVVPYLGFGRRLALERRYDEIVRFSATPTSFVSVSPLVPASA